MLGFKKKLPPFKCQHVPHSLRVGGNGSHAGALAIDNMCKDRGMCTSVIGVPKTIDNDILLLDRTFGFQTAVDEAIKAIRSGAIEAGGGGGGGGGDIFVISSPPQL